MLNALETEETTETGAVEIPSCPEVDLDSLDETEYDRVMSELSLAARAFGELATAMSKERDHRFPSAIQVDAESHERSNRKHYQDTQQRLRDERGERLAELRKKKISKADIETVLGTAAPIDRAMARQRNPYTRRPSVPSRG
jgi:hypothetical protein